MIDGDIMAYENSVDGDIMAYENSVSRLPDILT
jgi:hypothetical protein